MSSILFVNSARSLHIIRISKWIRYISLCHLTSYQECIHIRMSEVVWVVELCGDFWSCLVISWSSPSFLLQLTPWVVNLNCFLMVGIVVLSFLPMNNSAGLYPFSNGVAWYTNKLNMDNHLTFSVMSSLFCNLFQWLHCLWDNEGYWLYV